MDFPKTPDELFGKEIEFSQFLEEPKNWSSIPLLNYTPLHKLKDQTLVRFRGMIQDMQEPEIYLERYQVTCKSDKSVRMQNGKYRDCFVLKPNENVDFDGKNNFYGERRILFVVSLPGINDWAQEYEVKCNEKNVPNLEADIELRDDADRVVKRAAPVDIEEPMDIDNSITTDTNKRQRREETTITTNVISSTTTIAADAVNDGANDGSTATTQTATTTASPEHSPLSVEYLLNSPIPERPGKACIIKTYKGMDNFKLNTVIDVVGFLSVDPSLEATTHDMNVCSDFFENANELKAENPPPSLIPRIHAFAVHELPHANPLMDERLLSLLPNVNGCSEPLNMLKVQKDIKILLKLCLFNDELAAEYLLSHLISNVFSRDGVNCVGKFSLNLCRIPVEKVSFFTQKFYEILELLLPASHFLPLTLENLNTAAFVPKKDYETSKLISGLLQLAPHTHLVLDETQMTQGKLETHGVRGIQHIANLIKQQNVMYNFQYYEIGYVTNIPVLVLSEGRSMLPSDFVLPLQIDTRSEEIIEESMKAAFHFLNPERLEQFRRYLTKARTDAHNFTLEDKESEMVQNDFVEMRKTREISNVEELHGLLILSRLHGIARGKKVLDKESWELAKEMETERWQRLTDMPKSATTVSTASMGRRD